MYSSDTGYSGNCLETFSKNANLLISGGSDFHGEYTKLDVYLGNINGEKIKRKELTIISKL